MNASVSIGNRLSMCGENVRKNSLLADIGTDHAYLPAKLILDGTCRKAVAADIGKGPLSNAEKVVKKYGLQDKIILRLSDGLKEISSDEAEDIVIAGMGGILITEILSNCDWIKDKSKRFILQPQSHSENVRRFLCENGFEIKKENACTEGTHVYICIVAEYTGEITTHDDLFYCFGSHINSENDASKLFVKKQYIRFKNRYDALVKTNNESEEKQRLEKMFKHNTPIRTRLK